MAPTVQRAPITTAHGTFSDEIYTGVSSGDMAGVNMKVTFDPGDGVNATKIGMTQAVKSHKGGSPIVLDEDQRQKMVPDGSNAGYKTDRLTGQSNPIYGAKAVDAGLAETAVSDKPDAAVGAGPDDAKYTLGWRYKAGEDVKKKKAEMYDKPTLHQPPPDSGQVFETTALAIDGVDKGTYYGSVTWGWETASDGKFKVVEFAKLSEGTPTARFIDAAKMWNKFSQVAKVRKLNESGDFEVTAPITIKIKTKALVLDVGTRFNINPNKPMPKDGEVLVTLASAGNVKIQLGPGPFIAWVPSANIDKGEVTVDTVTESYDTHLAFTITSGSKLKEGSTVGVRKLCHVVSGDVSGLAVGLRIGWARVADVVGLTMTKLPTGE